LSVIASNLYDALTRRLKGYEDATPATVWREFLHRDGSLRITESDITIRVRRWKRAPVLLESGLGDDRTPIPWLGDRRIRLELS